MNMKQPNQPRPLTRFLAWSAALALAAGSAQAAGLGLNFVGTGTAVNDAGGAFGVPLAGWNNLTGPEGSTVISPPTGGAITITWYTGGGLWQSGATFPGFSTGENQVFSGNLYAGQNDPEGTRAITITVSGMDSIATGTYTLQLMAAIDGPATIGVFRPALLGDGSTLAFGDPIHSGAPLAAVTTPASLSGDAFSFTIANDNVLENSLRVRAELSGLVLTYTPAPAPVITAHPQSQTAAEGSTIDLTVTATGSAPLTYLWQFNDIDLPDQTTATLRLANLSTANAGNYRVKVTDSAGRFSYSANATLTVASPTPAFVYDWSPVFTFTSTGAYPAGVGLLFDVAPGTSVAVTQLGAAMPDATFSGSLTVQLFEVSTATVLETVTFTPDDVPTPIGLLYQWAKPVSNLVLASGSYAVVQYGGTYANVPDGYAVNSLGGAITHVLSRWTSGPGGPGNLPTNNDGATPKYAGPTFEAKVSGAPGITQHPQGGSFVPGTSATLSVTAGGSQPLTYQWQKDGTPIPGATSAQLALAPLGPNDTGDYRVVIANAFGSVTSASARVEVAGAPTVDLQLNPAIVLHGTVGLHYRIEWRDEANPGVWNLLQDIPSLASPTQVVYDPTPISATNRRFYQAVLVP